jgi:hypothetical protein
MGPQAEKLIEITYQIYSKEHDISFEKYIEEIVMNDDKKEIFDMLWEQAKKIDSKTI